MTKVSRALGAAMLCLVLLLIGNVTMAKQDYPKPAQDPAKKAEKQKTSKIDGTVSEITESTLTIVDSKKAEHTLAVTSETKVTKAGKDATLADVKANDIVTVEATQAADNTWTALKISVS